MSISIRTSALVVLVALSAGCRTAHQSQHSSAVLPISVVVADAINYSHRMITVRGCYVEAYERTTVQPCDSKKHEDVMWLDNAEILATDVKGFVPEQLVPKELQAPPNASPSEFIFNYDQLKTRAAWAKLYRIAPHGGEIVVTGQFDTVAPEKMNSESRGFGPGFGHLGQYQHRLLLVDVLDPEVK